MARANKKKLSDIANESDAKYDKVKLQAAAITETFTEGDDGPGHNEEALIYLKLKLEDIVDDINVLATDVVDVNTAKTGISTVQAATVNNLHLEGGALIPTTTERHTVSLSVTNSRGAYALVFTMVDGSGETSVKKTVKVNLS